MTLKPSTPKPMLKSIDARQLQHIVGGDSTTPQPWIKRLPVARPDDTPQPQPW